jgi:hypothetical protein
MSRGAHPLSLIGENKYLMLNRQTTTCFHISLLQNLPETRMEEETPTAPVNALPIANLIR